MTTFLKSERDCAVLTIATLTQLWLAACQLQAPPAADAVAHGAQALHAGHAAIDAATLERTPQTAVPVLRIGDGDRAPAHRTPGIQKWRGRAARHVTRARPTKGSVRGKRDLNFCR